MPVPSIRPQIPTLEQCHKTSARPRCDSGLETVSEEQHGQKTVVRTRLVKDGGDPINIDYIMIQSGEDWNIIDVIAKGRYSELAVRRAEFAPILRDRGFGGLLEMLKGKITEMETGAAAVE